MWPPRARGCWTGCSTGSSGSPAVNGSNSAGTVLQAAASIDAWGSILSQLGGTHVAVGYHLPGTVAIRHDLLHALDPAQRSSDVGAACLDQRRVAGAQHLVGEFHDGAH